VPWPENMVSSGGPSPVLSGDPVTGVGAAGGSEEEVDVTGSAGGSTS
jgi:hypothetical protein